MVLQQVMVVGPESPYATLADLLKAAKSKPGTVSFGSAGNGGSAHLSAALLETRGGAKMNHIPFRGNAPALIEVMAGRVGYMFYPMIGVADRVAAKQLEVIGVTTKQCHTDLPDVPTMAEAGFPGFEDYIGPVGFLAPAGTPPAAIARLSCAIRATLAKPAIQDKLRALGAVVVGSSPDEYRDGLKKDYDRWAQLIKDASMTAERGRAFSPASARAARKPCGCSAAPGGSCLARPTGGRHRMSACAVQSCVDPARWPAVPGHRRAGGL